MIGVDELVSNGEPSPRAPTVSLPQHERLDPVTAQAWRSPTATEVLCFPVISTKVPLIEAYNCRAPSCSKIVMVSSLWDAETMSTSPSLSTSAKNTSRASYEVEISTAAHDGSAAPSFSYHATVLSPSDPETMSKSPSPSMSAR